MDRPLQSFLLTLFIHKSVKDQKENFRRDIYESFMNMKYMSAVPCQKNTNKISCNLKITVDLGTSCIIG